MCGQCVHVSAGTSEPHASPTEAGPSQHSGQSQRVRTVFLFTDGQATTGITNNERLKQILSVMLQNAISPTIYCFGYGNNYSTDALDSISQAGQGSSCFIEDAEAIPGALASALGGLMSMSAQIVELTFTPQVSIKQQVWICKPHAKSIMSQLCRCQNLANLAPVLLSCFKNASCAFQWMVTDALTDRCIATLSWLSLWHT